MSRFKLLIIYITLLFFIPTTTHAKTIGVIVPLQHNAMNEIVAGIHEILDPILSSEDKIIVKNANGDPNLQRQIIQQMLDNGVDYFMPISTSTALMTISIVKTKPIIAVAAEFDHASLKKSNQNRISIINDHVQVNNLLQIIKNYTPEIKKVGFIYSNSEKTFPEIESAKEFCKKNNLEIALRKVDNIAEIYQSSQSIISEVDAVILLKDSMVVSGITGIAKLAKKYRKPLITMDNGSVMGGAHFAVGVPEEYIGIISAKALIAAINGNNKEAFRVITMEDFSIFYNTSSIKDQDVVSVQDLQKIADELSYTLVPIKHNKR
ncbi:MAG: hypothetical protein HRU35_07120 [Rickettsiaceae bacterium]|nr:hypothetical protein [Rickettsiaceae bacterium]